MAVLFDDLQEITGLTKDGTWRSVDLSGAPYNLSTKATGVILTVVNESASTAYAVGFRMPGSTDSRTSSLATQAKIGCFMGVSGRALEYNIANSNVKVYLGGYFEDDAYFYADAQAVVGWNNEAWTQLNNPTSLPATAKAAIFELCANVDDGTMIGVIPNGGWQMKDAIRQKVWTIVTMDGSRIFHVWANTSKHTIYINGYLKFGSFLAAYTNKSPASIDTWQDIDLSASRPFRSVGAILRTGWNSTPNADKQFGYRRKGSAADTYTNQLQKDQAVSIVKHNGSYIVEQKLDHALQETYLIGFLTDPLLPDPGEIVTDGVADAANAFWVTEGNGIVTGGTADVAIENAFTVDVPVMEVSFSGDFESAFFAVDIPRPVVSFDGHPGVGGTFEVNFPAMEVEFVGSIDFTVDFPEMVVSFTGDPGLVGQFKVTAAVPEVSFSGSSEMLGSFDVDFPVPVVSFDAVRVFHGDFDVNAKPLKVSFSGYPGNVGDFAIGIAKPKAAFTGFFETAGTFAVVMPAPSVDFFADIEPPLRYYKGVAVNLSNFAVTDYSGDYAFHSLFSFNGKVYGANRAGIYELTGDRDNGLPIHARFRTLTVDMWDRIKRLARYAWITGRSQGSLKLLLELDEKTEWEALFGPGDAALHEDKVKIARGIKNRFIAFEIRNQDGAGFDLEKLRVLVEEIQTRRR